MEYYQISNTVAMGRKLCVFIPGSLITLVALLSNRAREREGPMNIHEKPCPVSTDIPVKCRVAGGKVGLYGRT